MACFLLLLYNLKSKSLTEVYLMKKILLILSISYTLSLFILHQSSSYNDYAPENTCICFGEDDPEPDYPIYTNSSNPENAAS